MNSRVATNPLIKSLHKSWKNTPLSRDKADTLLLIFACIFVLGPHFFEMAWWVNVGTISLMGWRTWITTTGRRLPPNWVLVPIACIMMVGVYASFRTLFGREVGITMLALLLSCKLLEMHAKRDLYVVIFLNFFLLLSSFFYSQTIVSALLTMCAVVLLLTAQISFQYTGAIPSLWQRAKLAASMFGLAIPLTIVCFFLFPRIQGPLWSLPGDANKAKSGLSDTMAPGNISQLALSNDIAFRVKFAKEAPRRDQLYWRGIVLSQFDGRTWSHEEAPNAIHFPRLFSVSGDAIEQQVILEPNGQRWLFALDIPNQAPDIENINTRLNTQLELYASNLISTRVRYNISSFPTYALEPHLKQRELRAELELPGDFNPRTLDYARQLSTKFANEDEKIAAVLNWFRQEKFIYTLEPPLLGVNTIDDFLFSTRAGFCEHYASAFAVLMRAMNIPARVVTGYLGGVSNSVDGFFEVRQSDAHAWTEVWLDGRGWVRVDPTAAVAPERVFKDLSSTQPKTGLAGLTAALGNNSFLRHLRMQWDAINNSWNLWVLNYDQGRQLNFLRKLGFPEIDWPQVTALFFAIVALVTAVIALPLLRDKKSLTPIDAAYAKLCAKLAQRGYKKYTFEGPTAYQKRLEPHLNAQQFEALRGFLSLYTAAKYGKPQLPQNSTLHIQRQLKQSYTAFLASF